MSLFLCKYTANVTLDEPVETLTQTVRAPDAGHAYGLLLGWMKCRGGHYSGTVTVQELCDYGTSGVLVPRGDIHNFKV